MSSIRFKMPDPAPGQEFCPVCVMVVMGQVHRDYDAEIKAALADSKNDKQVWITPKVEIGRTLRYGVVRALAPMLPAANLILVCWEHAGGLTRPSSLAVAPPGLMGPN